MTRKINRRSEDITLQRNFWSKCVMWFSRFKETNYLMFYFSFDTKIILTILFKELPWIWIRLKFFLLRRNIKYVRNSNMYFIFKNCKVTCKIRNISSSVSVCMHRYISNTWPSLITYIFLNKIQINTREKIFKHYKRDES